MKLSRFDLPKSQEPSLEPLYVQLTGVHAR
jgi:hypothetical protein